MEYAATREKNQSQRWCLKMNMARWRWPNSTSAANHGLRVPMIERYINRALLLVDSTSRFAQSI